VVEPRHEQLEAVWDKAVHCLRQQLDEELKRFTVPRAALSLLGRNMATFANDTEDDSRYESGETRLRDSLLLRHVEVLLPTLLELGQQQNRDFRNDAVGVTREALARLARLLCQAHGEPGHRPRAVQVYKYLEGKVTELVRAAATRNDDDEGLSVVGVPR